MSGGGGVGVRKERYFFVGHIGNEPIAGVFKFSQTPRLLLALTLLQLSSHLCIL